MGEWRLREALGRATDQLEAVFGKLAQAKIVGIA